MTPDWLTDEEVKASLRALVVDDVLTGWDHFPDWGDREWIVCPAMGRCKHYDAAGIRSYVAMVAEVA